MKVLEDKIKGALVGMCLGDSLGMPGELWNREKIRKRFNYIDELLNGVEENDVSKYFLAGHFTDDSSQALVILNTILEYKKIPEVQIIAKKLLEWVYSIDGFNKNILGENSKASLLAHNQNEDYTKYTNKADTNGAAMRIPPIGCLIEYNNYKLMSESVFNISKVTHSTDAAVAGAAMIAQAVASAISGRTFEDILEDSFKTHDLALKLGTPTFNANCKYRVINSIKTIKDMKNDDLVSEWIYNTIGSGLLTTESVPAAISIAYYAKEPEKAAILSANLGGDTDTIGAMATAICGAYTGVDSIRKNWIKKIEEMNNINFDYYTSKILEVREILNN